MAGDNEDPAQEIEEVVDEKVALEEKEKEAPKGDAGDDKKDIGAGEDTNGATTGDVEQPVEAVSAIKVNEEELEEKARKNLQSELTKATEVKHDTDFETPESKKLDFLKKLFIGEM